MTRWVKLSYQNNDFTVQWKTENRVLIIFDKEKQIVVYNKVWSN